MNNKRIGYLPLVDTRELGFKEVACLAFNKTVLVIQKHIPEIPYLRIEIRIIEKETEFLRQRKKKRWLNFLSWRSHG